MEEIVNLIQTVGFPIAISTYLLFVFGAKIDRLTDAVEKLADLFDKNEKVKELEILSILCFTIRQLRAVLLKEARLTQLWQIIENNG